MFDDDDSKKRSKRDLKAAERIFKNDSAPVEWAKQPPEKLLQWMQQIRECLPATTLESMNVEQELLTQFQVIRVFQTKIINDDDIPANQIATVVNSVARILESIAKLQMEIYSSERFKALELLVVRTLRKLPEEQAATFIDEYEKLVATYSEKGS